MKIFKQFATAAMTFALACPLFTACGNGPVEQDEIEDMIEEVSWKSEQNIKERNEEYSYYYSNGSDNVSIYTYKPSTITITLSYYHQLKSMDEKNNTDGDPRIFFGVKSYSDGVRQDSVQTSTINLGDNVGTWSGSKSVTAKLSGGIDEILVCPVFTDADRFFDDHEYSSNYCYYVHDLGQKIGQTIQQDDYMATYFDLEWSVKVNYN